MNELKQKKERRFYDPPASVRPAPSSVQVKEEERCDCYLGAKDDLVAMGLLPAMLFPGEPGMPAASATIWPRGTERGSEWNTPGTVRINRCPSGKFSVTVCVSQEEQERRTNAAEADRERRQRDYKAARDLERAEKAACQSLDEIIRLVGLEIVAKRLRGHERVQRPRRDASHLRLVWSQPHGGAL